jgi:hypothetical protein
MRSPKQRTESETAATRGKQHEVQVVSMQKMTRAIVRHANHKTSGCYMTPGECHSGSKSEPRRVGVPNSRIS